jgi:hypothetical protein
MPAKMATPPAAEGEPSATSLDNSNTYNLQVPTMNRPLLPHSTRASASSISDDSHADGNISPLQISRPARSFNVNRGFDHFDVKNGIYLKTPFWMVTLFFVGLFAAVGHHVFYMSLDGDQVGSQNQQEWNLR